MRKSGAGCTRLSKCRTLPRGSVLRQNTNVENPVIAKFHDWPGQLGTGTELVEMQTEVEHWCSGRRAPGMSGISVDRRQTLVALHDNKNVTPYDATLHPEQRCHGLRAKRVFAAIPAKIQLAICSKRRLSQQVIEFRSSDFLQALQNGFIAVAALRNDGHSGI